MLSSHTPHSLTDIATRKPVNYENTVEDCDGIQSYLDLYGDVSYTSSASQARPPNPLGYSSAVSPHQYPHTPNSTHPTHSGHSEKNHSHNGVKRRPFLSTKAIATGRTIADMFRGWTSSSNRKSSHARYNSECEMPSLHNQTSYGPMMHQQQKMSRDTSMPIVPYISSATSATSPRIGRNYAPPVPAVRHQRYSSARPLPTTPQVVLHQQPVHAPRDPRVRRPTGPRDIPVSLKATVDNKTRVAFLQTSQTEVMQELQKLNTLAAAYAACPDPRLEEQLREKWSQVKGKTEAMENNIMALFPVSAGVVSVDSAKDLVECTAPIKTSSSSTTVRNSEPSSSKSISNSTAEDGDTDNTTLACDRTPSSRSSSSGSEVIKKFAKKMGLDVRQASRTSETGRRFGPPSSEYTPSNGSGHTEMRQFLTNHSESTYLNGRSVPFTHKSDEETPIQKKPHYLARNEWASRKNNATLA
ncbi:hypothetical protein BASA83_000018 [Batrachochytrium salamandrivorans]|nr:hypothetical protein BASA83_000018 [Batrachochytrium salamandrivorans]